MDKDKKKVKSAQKQTKPATSTPKFLAPSARPSSSQKKNVANLTLLEKRVSSVHSSFRGAPLRQNLDSTIFGSLPNIKQNVTLTPVIDDELELSFIYNDYLQALMKQQIVEKTMKEHEEKLNDQIIIQSEHMRKLDRQLKDIQGQIETIKEQSNTVEFLQLIESNFSEIECLLKRYNTKSHATELNTILKNESNMVGIKNIKPIKTQQEYSEMISNLQSLQNTMKRILSGEKSFEDVHQFACAINRYRNMFEDLSKQTEDMDQICKKGSSMFLKQTSDMFYRMGGYS